MQDLESKTLLDCMNMIAALPEDAQGRVMTYLSDRFLNGSGSMAAASVSAATGTSTGKKRGPKPGSKRTTATKSKRGRKPSKNKKSDYDMIPDLELAPAGKESLKDFVAKIEPKRHAEKHLAVLYYFENIAGLDGITISHIHTGEKKLRLKQPKDLYQSMLQASSTDKYFETSDVNNLKTTAKGKQWVESRLQ